MEYDQGAPEKKVSKHQEPQMNQGMFSCKNAGVQKKYI